MKYDIEELNGFLIVHIIGNMTAKEKPSVLLEAINEYISDGKSRNFLFNLEKVDNIDDDGIDVFINCLSLQSCNTEDKDIAWAQNLDENKIEKEIMKGLTGGVQTDGDEFSELEEDMCNLSDVYKEVPNAPDTGCFILVKDDDVYDKLHDFGVSELMTVYRTREDFTRDQGVVFAD